MSIFFDTAPIDAEEVAFGAEAGEAIVRSFIRGITALGRAVAGLGQGDAFSASALEVVRGLAGGLGLVSRDTLLK